MFDYIQGNVRSDRACGRRLACWPDVSRAGHGPSVDDIEDEVLRKTMVEHVVPFLFPGAALSLSLKKALLASLLQYHGKMGQEFPEHLVVTRLNKVLLQDFGIAAHQVKSACDDVIRGFRERNLEQMVFADTEASLRSAMEQQSNVIMQLTKEQFQIRAEISSIKNTLMEIRDLVVANSSAPAGRRSALSTQPNPSISSAVIGPMQQRIESEPSRDLRVRYSVRYQKDEGAKIHLLLVRICQANLPYSY